MITPTDINSLDLKTDATDHDWYAALPTLSPELLKQLKAIEPRDYFGEISYPCDLILKDGSKAENVYLTNGIQRSQFDGITGDNFQLQSSIASIQPSQIRFPNKYRKTLEREVESGMGYLLFLMETKDGKSYPYAIGNFYDFIELPLGVEYSDITKVTPHIPRNITGKYYRNLNHKIVYFKE